MDAAALLIMDVQKGITERFGVEDGYLARLNTAIQAARRASVPVFFIRIAFRPGFPEVSPENASFRAIRERAESGGPNMGEVDPRLSLEPDDVVVTKKRVSAFTGSDLEVLLRANGIRTLALAGIATSGVVLSTVREAADRDYGLVVLEDGCLDADPEVHRVLTEKVFVRQAQVMTVAAFVQSLAANG